MSKKNEEVQKEALEIIELAIQDLSTLARAFDLVGELSSRGCPYIEPELPISDSLNVH